MLIQFQHEGKNNHRGINETLEQLKRNYYWPSMKTEVNQYINNCQICQTAKYSRKKPYVPLVLTESIGKPFQLIHVDVFKFDNQNFLTIIDAFSKLVQAFPIPEKTAIEFCDFTFQFTAYLKK